MSTNKRFTSLINFTHGDLDGLGCQILTELAFDFLEDYDLKVVRCTDSGKSVDNAIEENMDWINDHENTIVIITDIVPTREYLETLVKLLPGQVRVIDHHKSNIWANEILPGSVFPGEPNSPIPSGTSLYYRYLLEYPDKVYAEDCDDFMIIPFRKFRKPHKASVNEVMLEDFVNIVRSWDIFEWAKTGYKTPKMMQTLFTLLGADEFARTMIKKIKGSSFRHADMFDVHELRFIEAAISIEKAKMDAVTIDKVKIVTIDGYHCAVMFFGGGMNFSDMATRFLNKYPLFDVFIGIMPGVGNGVLSYRTIRDDIDVAELFAKPNGGGGHPKAAGNPIDVELMEDVMNRLLPGEYNIWHDEYALLEAKS